MSFVSAFQLQTLEIDRSK